MFWKELFKEKFDVFILVFLLLILIFWDAWMVYVNRPIESLHWLQGLITGVFGALVTKLGVTTFKKEKDAP